MADVDGRWPPTGGTDRGQLLLVGALTLAVLLVVLAVLLNAAIYTGNVATRDAGPGTGEAIEYENEATSMAQSTIDALSERENMSEEELRQNFTRTVDEWSQTARVHSGASLADAEVRVEDNRTGTMILQDESREFTGPDGEEGWRVANDTKAANLQLNVSQDSLYIAEDADDAIYDAFRITFYDDSGGRSIQIYSIEDSGNVTIGVGGDSSERLGECSVEPDTDGNAVVELASGQIGDEQCPHLEELFNRVEDSYDVQIEYGDRASGTYSMVVDKSVDDVSVTTDEDVDGPYAKSVLYNAELELTYRTTDVYYQTEFEVTPGETDE